MFDFGIFPFSFSHFDIFISFIWSSFFRMLKFDLWASGDREGSGNGPFEADSLFHVFHSLFFSFFFLFLRKFVAGISIRF